MKTLVSDPWSSIDSCGKNEETSESTDNCFEDSFVSSSTVDVPRLPDSEQYLARLHSRLEAIQGGTSKRDLINSLSVAKEDCIARLINGGENFETPEEEELAANPIIRHVAPHLQALTASELVHLLKADVLQSTVNEQNDQPPENEDTESKSTGSQSDIQVQDTNGL